MTRRHSARVQSPGSQTATDLVARLRPDWTVPFLAAAALLIVAVLLGGASRQHELRLAVVELASLPLIVLSVFSLLKDTTRPATRLFLGVLTGVVAIPLLQLAPLPPAVWTRLPERGEMVLALELSGMSPGWSTLSLTPDKTWQSMLALLPPLAMVLGVLAIPPGGRRHLVILMLILTVAAVVLGALQLASGGEQLYPWETTNAGAVVGFFANRNHMATFCLAALPMAAALFAREMRSGRRNIANAWLSLALVALLIVAIGAIRSRMGLALLGPVLVASLLGAWIASGRGRPSRLFLILATVAGAGVIALANFAIAPILARFGSGDQIRFDNWTYVLDAAGRFAPWGSGIGSFDAVFRSVEPLETLDPTYFNQAHNDYLETWLETGWLGVALLAVFGVWFARRAWTVWRASGSGDRDIHRGATIAIAAILAHSAVDYPLRTATIATVLALLCTLLETGAHARSSHLKRVAKPSAQP